MPPGGCARRIINDHLFENWSDKGLSERCLREASSSIRLKPNAAFLETNLEALKPELCAEKAAIS
ncbi:hypothetical protein [Prosthecobacter sp.]|uniref:hypothetical protein n=1 Tax=Prosthecobacter sp. TaxID=1965333 RepID=UPI003783B931